jgi:hypothetical protein
LTGIIHQSLGCSSDSATSHEHNNNSNSTDSSSTRVSSLPDTCQSAAFAEAIACSILVPDLPFAYTESLLATLLGFFDQVEGGLFGVIPYALFIIWFLSFFFQLFSSSSVFLPLFLFLYLSFIHSNLLVDLSC